MIVDSSAVAEIKKAASRIRNTSESGFQLPPVDLFDEGDDPTVIVDEQLQQQLNDNAEQLITTLNHYGVRGQIHEILPGPTVTTFEMQPEAGTKVSKIASLADDMAMSLGSQVRIIAPIPGKKRVGFEIPNRTRKSVSLRDLIEDRRFQEMKAPLPVVLGRDIVGKPFYADLSSMPHVLVAGATGAGKSVGLNVMLVSLLCRRSPDDLRLLMVDPKVVELQSFDRIPHMLLPVVTDMKQAANALKWAVDEMERRYQLLANAGTKNITTYNAWVKRVHAGEVPGFEIPKPKVLTSEDGSVIEFGVEAAPPKLPEKLPYIVAVVDEFADLMMQQGKEVEASIARLAQKARAAGMHVILATQRPSVDVITGMIKANFPSRVAFKVTQRNDSRIILDEQGAEHLLGRGDMLVKLNGSSETRRVQCPFVSEEEVERVTSFLRAQGEPTYDDSILQPRDDDGDSANDDAEQDSKYDEAVLMVAQTRRCSTSWIQRKLGVGYNRAAKIVEMMEKRGLVGPSMGAKDREVLIDPM
ncbi:MAG: FtsK/SpoIIIE domain-containing protein [Polyangiaceae bacterium]|nr:FtsK/SpoIIIE domain-containing protein [Polyangiaceae bacterium]